MSKKKGNKKKVELDDDFEETKNIIETSDITSKSKGKGKKKSKAVNDFSDGDDGDNLKKAPLSDEEDLPKPVKKSQKKGKKLYLFM